MPVEVTKLQKEILVKSNGTEFLIRVDAYDLSTIEVVNKTDGGPLVSYGELIRNRRLSRAFMEIKEWVDMEFGLKPIESEKGKSYQVKNGKAYKRNFNPRPCDVCGEAFTPDNARQRKCVSCKEKLKGFVFGK